MLVLCLAVGGLQVLISYAARDFTTALVNRNAAAFYHNLWQYLGAFVLAVPVMVFYRYTSDRLSLAWRQWMTEHLVQRYFAHRVYYHLRRSELDVGICRLAEAHLHERARLLVLVLDAHDQRRAFDDHLQVIDEVVVDVQGDGGRAAGDHRA